MDGVDRRQIWNWHLEETVGGQGFSDIEPLKSARTNGFSQVNLMKSSSTNYAAFFFSLNKGAKYVPV